MRWRGDAGQNGALTTPESWLVSATQFSRKTVNMPNTKSAEKRVRGNVRKAARNQSVKSRLKTLEKKYVTALTAGKVDEAKAALLSVASAYDKASKGGVIHKSTAQRKRSRLQLRLNAATAPKAAA